MVTQPDSRTTATSELPATSSRVLNPCVRLPTLQLPWSAATVLKVRWVAFIQNTHPAATRPVRPSGRGGGIGSSNGATPAGASAEKVIASGRAVRWSPALNASDSCRQSALVMVRG
jgi:hypothetical protein